MWKLEDRGPMMIEPGWKVYQGMIVGEHTRDNDLEINVLKGKQLTNIRAAGKDEAVRLTPPIRMTLEKALAYIEDDELVEVTPKSIRLRKTQPRSERPQARRADEGKRRWLTARSRLGGENPWRGETLQDFARNTLVAVRNGGQSGARGGPPPTRRGLRVFRPGYSAAMPGTFARGACPPGVPSFASIMLRPSPSSH